MSSGPAGAFTAATAVEPDGDGCWTAQLHADWSVGGMLHGGYLLAVVARAAVAAADPATPDPVAVSALYLRPPVPGPAVVRVAPVKRGRTASVRRAVLEQDGRACLEATVTTGVLPDVEPVWAEPHDGPRAPGPDAVDVAATPRGAVFALGRQCDVRLDPARAAFLRGETGPPELQVWARPRGEEPDLLFALLAGDVAMPTTFNLGEFGWTPTVQLTALLRARPAPGWLSVSVRTSAVAGGWFDEDATVTDAAGRLVCQARQLALLPLRGV